MGILGPQINFLNACSWSYYELFIYTIDTMDVILKKKKKNFWNDRLFSLLSFRPCGVFRLFECYPKPITNCFTIHSGSILVWDTHFSQSNQFLMDETPPHMFFSCWISCFTQKYVTLQKQNGYKQPFTWTLNNIFQFPELFYSEVWQQDR